MNFSVGVYAPFSTEIVIRNTAAGNTVNFNVHANMPVVTPATLGTNPNANISY